MQFVFDFTFASTETGRNAQKQGTYFPLTAVQTQTVKLWLSSRSQVSQLQSIIKF